MFDHPSSVDKLVRTALACRPADRAAFLDEVCRDSPGIRALVEHRLRAGDQAGSRVDDFTHTLPRDSQSRPPDESRFSPGEIVADRFTIVRYLAHGGMGEVYEAADTLLQGTRVALKVILPAIADDPESSHRFEQEVILARKLIHPNLCPIYDIARSHEPPPPFLFLTMKLVAGETLSSRLRGAQPLSPEQKVSVFRQMIAGLSAIHAGGIIHRDIKPNNIMLDESGPEICVVIMDFGLARMHEPDETAGAHSVVAGTPGYMAPEILNGQGPSQATDLFALGVLLHQVFAGERPQVSPETFTAVASPGLEQPNVPPALKHAVREFLSSEPRRRCDAFKLVQMNSGSIELGAAADLRLTSATSPRKPLTRRQFIVSSAAAAGVATAGITWRWDQIYELLHPLPTKRFVALLNWPVPDPAVKPLLLGVIDAIGKELARAEAFDRNLLVLPPRNEEPTTRAELDEARESLGANLVLAASALRSRGGDLSLSLRVLDPSYSTPVRAHTLRVPAQRESSMPEEAVRTAARLLGIKSFRPDDERTRVGTDNLAAFDAFRDAEALRKQENDVALDQAIERYKQAIELDPTYAVAQAKLAWAYLRAYGLKSDPAALALARLNCETAIQRQPDLIDAHLGLASVLQITGDPRGASEEFSKALALDPSDPHTLTYQANFYASHNQWDIAERTFERVLSLRPNYWLGHHELGVMLDREGKYHDALVQFRAASLAAPKNAQAMKNTGAVYLQLGQIPQALNRLQPSFALKADHHAAVALAELFRIQHKYPEALEYAQQAVKLNPNSPEVWLEIGDVYLSAGRRAPADESYRQGEATQQEELRTSPSNGPGWMVLAFCRARHGASEAALTLVGTAEANHADDMESQLLKIRILELAGRRDDALVAVARCLSRGPAQFQLEVMPDLEKLRTTAAYKSIVASSASTNES